MSEPDSGPFVSSDASGYAASNLENQPQVTEEQSGTQAPRGSVSGIDLLIGVPVVWLGELTIATFLILFVGGEDVIIEYPRFLVVSGLASGLITLLVSWSLVCRKYKRSFFEGFTLTPIGEKGLRRSVVIGIAGALGGSLLMYGFSTGESFVAQITSTRNGFLAFAALALILPPVEEVYYRGFIFPALEKKLGGVWAIVAVTVWFGLVHAAQLAGDWAGIPVVMAMGAIWTVQRYVSGSLTPSLISHWVYNFSLVLLGLSTQ